MFKLLFGLQRGVQKERENEMLFQLTMPECFTQSHCTKVTKFLFLFKIYNLKEITNCKVEEFICLNIIRCCVKEITMLTIIQISTLLRSGRKEFIFFEYHMTG